MIRTATTGDVARIYRIERRCFGRRAFSKAHIIWVLNNPTATTYIYYNEEKPVATIMLNHEGDVARVVSIGVLPEHRKSGIGRDLMVMAEKLMWEKGVGVMKLEVSVNNSGAIAFYQRLGYDFDGVLKGYYSWGEDAHVMRKTLGGS